MRTSSASPSCGAMSNGGLSKCGSRPSIVTTMPSAPSCALAVWFVCQPWRPFAKSHSRTTSGLSARAGPASNPTSAPAMNTRKLCLRTINALASRVAFTQRRFWLRLMQTIVIPHHGPSSACDETQQLTKTRPSASRHDPDHDPERDDQFVVDENEDDPECPGTNPHPASRWLLNHLLVGEAFALDACRWGPRGW